MEQFLWAKTADDYAAAFNLFSAYAKALNIDLCFQNFEEELLQLPFMYGLPNGGIILCKANEKFIACAGIRRFNENAGEIKRMYVHPEFRNKGIANKLLLNLVELAKNLNYTHLYLDTLDSMKGAIKLYKINGFEEIDAYYKNPLPGVLYFKKELKSEK